MSKLSTITNGFIKENPVFVLVLGTCPTLATSTSAVNSIGMGLAATFVLICSNFVISCLRKSIPDKVRIPCYIVVIAGFVSVVQTLPEFQAILNYIFSLNMAPFLVLILSINIVGALTGSSSSAIRIGMPMAMQHCIDAGMSLAFVQRLGAFAASILDTLPHSSAIIINLGIADQDMKEAYPPMAVTTILTTAVGTAAVAIFMSLFPSLP